MFRCAHEDRVQQRQDAKEAFERIMRKKDTTGELMKIMMKCIEMWENDPEVGIEEKDLIIKFNGKDQVFRKNDSFSRAVHVAAQNQNDTGWYNLLKGRMSKNWKKAQETCYRAMKKDKKFSGDTCGMQLILELWGC